MRIEAQVKPAPPWGCAAGEGMRHVLTADAIAVTEPTSENHETNLLNLLIVDDERSMRESCREVAQSLGFNTRVADSPEHAYHALDTTPVDVVLLDLRLPGASGLDVLREIKRAPSRNPGHRDDRLRHRAIGGAGHEAGGLRLHHQALQLRRAAPGAGAGDRAPEAHQREPAAARAVEVQARLWLTGRPCPGDGEAVPHHRQGRAQHPSRAHPGGERHRQGAGGALHSLLRALSRQALHPRGLRFAGAHPDRERAVRLRARRLHRRGAGQGRADGHRRRRHHLSGRSWRAAG